jgi:para-aminobenzoate synthetase component 1
MIVDLARNDLGRVCEFGLGEGARAVRDRAHPGLFHLVSTVTGRSCAPDVGPRRRRARDVPARVGHRAPKPRVMQAIEDLEPVRRGVYCGAVGWVDRRGPRRARGRDPHVHDRRRPHVSRRRRRHRRRLEPDDEWAETELKAARLLAPPAGEREDVRVDRRTAS